MGRHIQQAAPSTTAIYTGIHTGAIIIVQEAFNKRLLFLACRHHILEIIAGAVFDMFFISSGPQISIFSRFKDHWRFIDQQNYAEIDKVTAGCLLQVDEKEWLQMNRNDVVKFLQHQLKKEVHRRNDYLEFIKLTLITLGEPINIQFSSPGAYHRARWMAKGIYCLKIFCFREQFKLTAQELQALQRICLFTITIYVMPWFNATSSSNAPYNDLCLLQKLESYVTVDKKVAQVALKKLKRSTVVFK